VFNVLGAGDAFMAGFLRGWLRDEPLTRCCTYANGCGALVVSRHGCAPAMPSFEELQYFIDKGAKTKRVREDADIEHLHRVTTRTRHWKELVVLAFDHRVQLEQVAGNGADARERIEKFKRLVAEGGRRAAANTTGVGMILDDRYGENTLPVITGQGWWIARPVELPGSRPLVFEHGPQPAVTMRNWPEEHVAKCLVSYHPDDEKELREEQLASLQQLQQACIDTRHDFLLEVIPPRSMPCDNSTIARAMDQIYAVGIRPDWWKLPPSLTAAGWNEVTASIQRNDPHCRGVVVLGLEASEENLEQSFRVAAQFPMCKGFAVGRSIFADAASAWFAGRMNDEDVIADIARRYTRLIDLWRGARAAVPLVGAVG
jgi:5-dehydro-2-deoxygluconokinase